MKVRAGNVVVVVVIIILFMHIKLISFDLFQRSIRFETVEGKELGK